MPNNINVDKLVRAISLLTALRDSIKDASEYNDLSDSHVSEFHTRLSSITNIGIDVTEFLIPDSEVEPRVLSIGPSGRTYSTERYVRKSIFLTKLDGILNYLNYILKEPKRSAGFKPKE